VAGGHRRGGRSGDGVRHGDFNYAENPPPVATIVSPVGGGEVQTARETMNGIWTVTRRYGTADRPDERTWVTTNKFITPPRDYVGSFFKPFPLYFGDGIWTNREYQWRLRAFQARRTAGPWSSVSATTNNEFL